MQKLIRPLFSMFRNAISETDDNKKTVTHYIMSGEPNDYQQVLDPAGYDDTRYRKNPIVLFQHGLTDMFGTTPARLQLDFVLGRNTSIRAEGNYLKAETEFRNDDSSGFASDVFNLYKLGFLNGWSKWFYPISEPQYDSSTGNVKYDKWGIYEYSSVFVPVDSDATTREANYLNALESVKSNSMKSYFIHSLLGAKAAGESESSGIIKELENIKNDMKAIDGTDRKEDMRRITNESIDKYHKIILPRLEGFAESIKELNDLKYNLEALVAGAVAKSLRAITGKIE